MSHKDKGLGIKNKRQAKDMKVAVPAKEECVVIKTLHILICCDVSHSHVKQFDKDAAFAAFEFYAQKDLCVEVL